MYPKKQTRKNKNYPNNRNEPPATIKITGATTEIVAEIQDIIAEAYGERVILSPILRSQPSGFHAFCTIQEDSR